MEHRSPNEATDDTFRAISAHSISRGLTWGDAPGYLIFAPLALRTLHQSAAFETNGWTKPISN